MDGWMDRQIDRPIDRYPDCTIHIYDICIMGASNVVSLIEPQLRIIIITITTTRNIITIMSYYQLY